MQNKFFRATALLLVAVSLGFSTISYGIKPIKTTDLFHNFNGGEPWDKSVNTTMTSTVTFLQTLSGLTDASAIAKVTLAYFASNNCTGAKSGSGFYVTPDGTAFPITVGTSFGLVDSSAWLVGNTQLGIADMTTINSIAISFKSTNFSTPQSKFAANNLNYFCIPVTCTFGPSGTCSSGSPQQNFILKTTAAVGDPADGGIIACQQTGVPPNNFNLVVPITSLANQTWLPGPAVTISPPSTSMTNGATNTANIIACLTGPGGGGGCPQNIAVNTYAAGNCSNLSVTGGYTSGWFLPAGSATSVVTNPSSQLNCIYTNRAAIDAGATAAGGSAFVVGGLYWSSTENTSTTAWNQTFSAVTSINSITKNGPARPTRCARDLP